MALVSCEKLGEALVEWLDQASELERETLCDALGCGSSPEDITEWFDLYFAGGQEGQVWTKLPNDAQGWADALTSLNVEDSESVTFSGSGTPEDPTSAEVRVSSHPDNLLTGTPEGLFVEAPDAFMLRTENTDSVTLSGDGTVVSPLKAETKVSDEEGNAIEVREDGLFVEPSEGGDVCEQMDSMDVLPNFGSNPRIIVSNDDGCGVVEVDPTGIFSDIRAGAVASPASILENQTSDIAFSVRNVGGATVDGVRMILTFPSVDPNDPEFSIGSPVITNPTNADIDEVSSYTFEIGPLEAGDVVTITYPVTFNKEETYQFSNLLEILDPDVIDFDQADDYAVTAVTVRYREEPQPDPIDCPLMGITTSVNGGPDWPVSMTSGVGRISTQAQNHPELLVFTTKEDEYGDPSNIVIKSQVPITLLAYATGGVSRGAKIVVEGVGYSFPRGAGDLLEFPEGSPPPSLIDVEGDLENREFTISYTGAENGEGGAVSIAVRPGPECKWQQFAIVFGKEEEPSALTFTGNPPPLTKHTSYRPITDPNPIVLTGGSSALIGTTSPQANVGSINIVEEAVLTPVSGTAYSFTVTSTGPVDLGTTSASGNISVDVVSNTEWNVEIAETASSADNITLGRLTFTFND